MYQRKDLHMCHLTCCDKTHGGLFKAMYIYLQSFKPTSFMFCCIAHMDKIYSTEEISLLKRFLFYYFTQSSMTRALVLTLSKRMTDILKAQMVSDTPVTIRYMNNTRILSESLWQSCWLNDLCNK